MDSSLERSVGRCLARMRLTDPEAAFGRALASTVTVLRSVGETLLLMMSTIKPCSLPIFAERMEMTLPFMAFHHYTVMNSVNMDGMVWEIILKLDIILQTGYQSEKRS